MSFRNGLHNFALGGWLLAALLVPCSLSAQDNKQVDAAGAKPDAAPQPQIVLERAHIRGILDDVEPRIANWAFWIVVIAIVQSGAGVIALGVLFAAVRQTRRIANAAMAIAEAPLEPVNREPVRIPERTLDMDAPFMNLEFDSHSQNVFRRDGRINPNPLKYAFANYGRTPARLLRESATFEVRDVDAGLPEPHQELIRAQPNQIWQVAPPAATGKESFCFYQDTSDVLRADPDKQTIFFRGQMIYSDLLGNKFVLGHCFAFDWQLSQFRHVEDPRLNYCRPAQDSDFQPPA